jgi:CheY-like chemotaxis protein
MSGYILVVDDEPEIIELFELTLRTLKYRIVSVSDGDEAIEQIGKEKPSLILLDLMMPRMSGFHVLAQLKNDPETASIPVVVVSAYLKEQDAADLPGVIRVLAKGSFGAPELRQVVASCLAA